MSRISPPLGLALLALAVPGAALATGATSSTSLGSVALTLLPSRTAVDSGATLTATLVVHSTGTEAATGVSACLTLPNQLAVTRAPGAQRKGRRVCFTFGDLAVDAEASRTVTLRAAAAHTVTVQMSARASSTCVCSGQPFARSPAIRIVRKTTDPRVTG